MYINNFKKMPNNTEAIQDFIEQKYKIQCIFPQIRKSGEGTDTNRQNTLKQHSFSLMDGGFYQHHLTQRATDLVASSPKGNV